MKKSVQAQINTICENEYEKMVDETMKENTYISFKRLRSCKAFVYEFKNYYVLCSYNSIVAFIDKRTDTLYDALRMVYGYTATSAQHISKFEKDYCDGKWNCADRFTYRDI